MTQNSFSRLVSAAAVVLGVGAYGVLSTALPARADGDSTSPATSAKHMFEDLTWQAGEPGTQVARLWGTDAGPRGMLVQARAGYSSGPIARASDYRAFVISGLVSNDVPAAAEQEPMGSGTFWVQPRGTAHIMACQTDCMFYVEPEGAWSSVPPTQVGETQDGLEVRRISPEDMPWVDAPNTGGAVRLAHVWGDPTDAGPSGFFLFFKAGFPGFAHTHTQNYDGVVLQGRPRHWEPGEPNIQPAAAGSHLWQAGGAPHDDSCDAGADCITYFRFHGTFDIQPAG